jgi:hypothetical protein
MAAECEWSQGDAIVNDFEKLLVARADLKVMVFERDDPATVQQTVERLTALERSFERRQTDDVYLLVGRNYKTSTFAGYRLTNSALEPMVKQ